MIRHLRAMIWLRWRLLANALHGGRRRDALEQISRVLALGIPLVIVALSTGSVVAIGLVGFLGGRAAATHLFEPPLVFLILRGVLLGVTVLVLVLSVSSPAQTALSRYTRLLLLPIHRRVLHLVEVLANLADPWLMLAGVGLVAFAAGLFAGGRPLASLVALATAGLWLFSMASLGALVSFLIGSLVRSRRRGELFTLLFVLLLSLAGLLPAILAKDLDRHDRVERRTSRRFSPQEFEAGLPAWSRVLPSEIGGRTMEHAVGGNAAGVTLGLAMLAVEGVALFAGSTAAHRRLIDTIESDQNRRRKTGGRVGLRRLPFISAGASAVAWAQARNALRSVRGRLAVLIPGPMITMLALLLRGQRESGVAGQIAEHGYLVAGTGLVFALYAIQAFTMNFFGSDRAGLSLQMLAPLSDRDLAWGKAAGGGIIYAVAATFCLAGALVVNPSGSPWYWMAVVVAGLATYLLYSPFAVWLSALFPVAADLSKTGSGGNPHPLPMFAGTFLVVILAAPAAVIIAGADIWLERPIFAPLLMLAWLAFAAVVAVPAVRLAARAIGARRENLLLTAQSR